MGNYRLKNSMLTVREVSQLLHIHRNTVGRWADRGILRAYHITHRGDRRFRRVDIIRFARKLNAYGGDEKKAASIFHQATREQECSSPS